MASRRARRARSTKTRGTRGAAPTVRITPEITPSDRPARLRALLEEAPTAHGVCRVCGRIARFPLPLDDELTLERIAQSRPDGWSADRITLSVAGACPRCSGAARD